MIDLQLSKYIYTSEGDQMLTIEMQIETGSVVALYGSSGVGKTTLLRMLAGLTKPDDGHIEVNGQIWFDKKKGIHVSPQKRGVGMVFQEYALFPNMTVRQNIEYGLADHRDKRWVDELLELTDLTQLSSRKPGTLSGGQQQRVALCRTLAHNPSLLLLDEAFSSLDQATRTRLQDETLRLHRHFSLTTILVSHDIEEIRKMADVVIKIEQGKIIKQGKPADLLYAPKKYHHIELTGILIKVETVEGGCILTIHASDSTHRIFQDSGASTVQTPYQWKIGDTIVITLPYESSSVRRL
ncbi:ATP-binding cassette domain-containing protein [Cytophagaceae bacterium DM2B3-1]|uniref:ATP-binding cassette domain-containing protein n=1 Tax=Xanthocytophaga flava TaxID=3048013 RepID=A0ABT7CSE7_9BACT|nr:ATP-binding cassette domain-containing protein [Xanthocytophaga flavus]MDJ1496658.1 ATP-binding cassette domain-containing protein [Xanthocytophaga flavus]